MNQQSVDTLLVEKNTTFLVKNFTTLLVETLYISGFYYDSGSKVTTFLGFTTILVKKILHFWVLLLVIYYVSGSNNRVCKRVYMFVALV